MKKRDGNILKAYHKEINLSTKVLKDKTKYLHIGGNLLCIN